MMWKFLIISGLVILTACKEDETIPSNMGSPTPNSPPNNDPEWLIPKSQVLDGGPGKDGIPSIDNPQFITAAEASYLGDNDIVIGFKSGDTVRAYPHPILDWHEIINDEMEEKKYAITYCPLTGTGIAWNRVIKQEETTFGVSGLLYNNNLIPYDRRTESNWSQMRLDCVNGTLKGTEVEFYQVVETNWSTWKTMYPDTRVVSTNTGFSRNYGQYPYVTFEGTDYREDPFLLFPIESDDRRLPRKERVHGIIIGGDAKVYRFNSFSGGLTVYEDEFNSEKLVIAGSEPDNFIVSFSRILEDGTELFFNKTQEPLPVLLEDNEGNLWDIFGKAVSGPRQGEKLVQTKSYIGYWFAWGTFYPFPKIYGQ